LKKKIFILTLLACCFAFAEEKQKEFDYQDMHFKCVGTFKTGWRLCYDTKSVYVDKEKKEVRALMLNLIPQEEEDKIRKDFEKLYQDVEKETGQKPAVNIDALTYDAVLEKSMGCIVKTDCKSDSLDALCQDSLMYKISLPEGSPYRTLRDTLCKDVKF